MINSSNKPFSLFTWFSIGSVVLASLLGIGLLFLNQPNKSGPDFGSAQSVAKEFLEKVRKGEIDQAWDSASTDFKSYMGKATFRSLVKKTPALREVLTEKETLASDAGQLVKCEFVSTNKPIKITLTVVQEKNTTKIGALQIQ